MKLWAYLFIAIIISVLLYFLAIVPATNKGIDLKFSAYSELIGVAWCSNKIISPEFLPTPLIKCFQNCNFCLPKNKCLFQAKRLDDIRYNQWLKRKSDKVTLCSYCKKEINIGNMDETALTSHLQGKKYQEISKFSCTNHITSFLKKPSETEKKS